MSDTEQVNNLLSWEELKKSLMACVWMMFLTFPIMVIQVNTIHRTVEWRWDRMFVVGIGAFLLSFFWRYFIRRKEAGIEKAESGLNDTLSLTQKLLSNPQFSRPAFVIAALFFIAYPFIFSLYQIDIMTTALIYVVVALGLNIVVGLAGLLDLGYVAFFAVGSYAYALLNYHFGLGFWLCLPIGGALGFVFGVLLGFPVLRLRGDYLAIVTLGFCEIIRTSVRAMVATFARRCPNSADMRLVSSRRVSPSCIPADMAFWSLPTVVFTILVTAVMDSVSMN